jgi:hypothetical protein
LPGYYWWIVKKLSESVRSLLLDEGIEAFGEAEEWKAGDRRSQGLRPDIVALDYSLPDLGPSGGV